MSTQTTTPPSKAAESKMFDNPVLEKLTRTNSIVVVSAYTAISVIFYGYGYLNSGLSFWMEASMFICGLLLFTLMEYLIHRFTYHSHDYKEEEAWQYKVHGYHHEFPKDKDRLALPLPVALLVAGLLFYMLYLAMGNFSYHFFSGFILGYGGYLFVHYIVHTRRAPNNMFGYLWKHHNLHHYKYEDKAFGVSTPLWDFIFGTMPPKVEGKSTRVGANKS
ncbi:sterol desaturase family protein [Luteibaculum oceani]|uniref:Fatty acid hydroxylase n=1 Tax=Luteibaculum oceani TaxID=1294296 RepID=A0A5C6UZH5_9FLAO|nr:sterol desaturase family protein [Luteibaculum oceani]TXC76045.1 fatty acid hydroxylase [Luteibaculum oceani]